MRGSSRRTPGSSTLKVSRDSTTGLFVRPRRARIPLVWKLFLVVALFVVIEGLLVGLTYFGMETLSAARAYVAGEAIWSKSQKEAVYRLRKYCFTRDRWDYEGFLDAIAVPLGDRQARRELETADPDLAQVQAGFLRGGNHPEDVARMARLFGWVQRFEAFSRAIDTWRIADLHLGELLEVAGAIREHVQAGAPAAELDLHLERVDAINSRLAELEEQFGRQVNRGARDLERLLLWSLVGGSLLLLTAAMLIAWALLISVKRSEEALQESERRYRALAESSAVGIWHIDATGSTIYLNPAMARLLELDDRSDIRQESYHRFFSTESLERIRHERQKRYQGKPSSYEAELVGLRGTRRTVLISGAPIESADGVLEGTIGTFVDITERKAAEELLEHQALHDPLTDLPNRALFTDRLEQALRRTARRPRLVAVLFIDLDRFKVINDSLGHSVGDALLVRIGERLKRTIRQGDTVARLGGDEFAILLEEIPAKTVALETAHRLQEALGEPLKIRGTPVRLTASIGIAFHDDGTEAGRDALLRYADIAMYAAKRRGGDGYHVFDPVADSLQTVQLHLESELWHAAERGELSLDFQPIVDLEGGQVIGLEALVRWDHPDRGRIDPDDFISLAEETGAIVPLGAWVLGEACRHLARWNHARADRPPLWVSVNLSERQLRRPDLHDEIRRLLDEHGLSPSSLHFEITETLLTQVPTLISRLRGMGIPIAIDDFGTGYSSLVALKNITVDTLKIDRTFVSGMSKHSEDAALVTAAVQLAQALGVCMTAEGIETKEQLRELRELGCSQGQGFLFSPPRPAEEIEALLAEDPHW